MDTNALKKFAQAARTLLIDQVTGKLAVVLDPASAARREHPEAMKALEGAIADKGETQVVEQVAYTWFNRFTALRFMDVNGYTLPRVVSPADGETRPEILAEAMAGNLPEKASAAVGALLEGRAPSRDPQGEAYRLLLVHVCNAWHEPMPYLFEKFDDYTELLMPEDLLSQGSILGRLREVLTAEVCADVEVIGWLYQFYISEKKEQVFGGLKKNQKISVENIPAATQLFTPHWIVRYLVENSLGRLWLLNRPSSRLAERMDYYISPDEPETNFIRVANPEEIKVCDPACGSGHMLTYAFDLLYAIYEEEGYQPDGIPGLILANNLTGVEIDDRAGALAAFALAMKAAARLHRRRFLRMTVKPNICVLQDVKFSPEEMRDVAAVVGREFFTPELRETLGQFEQAKNLGSLVIPKLQDPAEVLRAVVARELQSDLLLSEVQERVACVLGMADALSPKYHVVVANPPYMGGKGMNGYLSIFAKNCYPDSKSDLFSMFMERTLSMTHKGGMVAMINMQSWMFLSTFEKLRLNIFSRATLISMAHLGERGFDTIGGSVVSTTAFVVLRENSVRKGYYVRLVDGANESEKASKMREAIHNRSCGWLYRASIEDFAKIPGSPVAYWVSDKVASLFSAQPSDAVVDLREGIHTGDNDRFLRLWHETSTAKRVLGAKNDHEVDQNGKWVPYNKGGTYRKWYGNNNLVIAWDSISRNEMSQLSGHVRPSKKLYFKEGGTWSALTSGSFGIRYYPEGFLFDSKGQVAVGNRHIAIIGQFNTKLFQYLAKIVMPTLDYKCGDVKKLPFLPEANALEPSVTRAIELARADWDAYETSWDFTTLPLLSPDHRADTLQATYSRLRVHWQGATDKMRRLEEENNRIFIDAYGLQDELTPEVPLEEITLTCNPAYRYGGKASAEDLEERLRADTLQEFLHYAVGCMFGRYSLDAPGLILANQGEGLEEYLASVPNPTFEIDPDNVIPVLDGEWFADDIADRFRKFLRVTFGEAKFQENLAFIEAALGKDIRKWFTKDFFDYHVRRFKKRPIYWMFSSPKGSFNALIYMHLYRPDTVSIVLNDYLREFISKLQAERARLEKLSDDSAASPAQRTRALKDVGTVIKQIAELEAWEREVVFPLAQAKIEIDLDDGVKRNYPKFGAALKPIKGLETADE